MAKGSKLKAALDNFKGVDKKAEHQKQVQKAGLKNAEKRKRAKIENDEDDGAAVDKAGSKSDKTSAPPAKKSKKNKAQRQAKRVQLAAVAAGATLDDIENGDSDVSEIGVQDDHVVAEKEWETDEEEEEHTLAVRAPNLLHIRNCQVEPPN